MSPASQHIHSRPRSRISSTRSLEQIEKVHRRVRHRLVQRQPSGASQVDDSVRLDRGEILVGEAFDQDGPATTLVDSGGQILAKWIGAGQDQPGPWWLRL